MTDPTTNPVLSDSAALLVGYGFDLGVFEVEELVSYWLSHYPPHWLRAAILEALHQGRYKAISVGQILVIWRRRGQPLPHYSYEFERAVCQRFPLSRAGSGALATATSGSNHTADVAADLLADDESGPGSDAAAPPAPGNGDLERAIASPDWPERPLDQEPENATVVSDEPTDLSQGIPPIKLEMDLEPIAPFADRLDLQGQPLGSGSDSSATPTVSAQPDLDPSHRLPAHPESTRPQMEIASPTDAPLTADAVEYRPADSAEDDSLELWGRASSMHLPIHQYVPIIPRFETSTFYAKLRAVAASDEVP